MAKSGAEKQEDINNMELSLGNSSVATDSGVSGRVAQSSEGRANDDSCAALKTGEKSPGVGGLFHSPSCRVRQ